MPEVESIGEASVVFLSTEIGRGHPSYLDGLAETVRVDFPHIPFCNCDVFSLSRGISLAAWNTVRRMYRIGGKGGAISSAYGRMRRGTGTRQGRGLLLAILGRDLQRHLAHFSGIVVAAHPIVARILSARHDTIYQHGEMAAPPESLVSGCRKILVPLEETADRFFRAGFSRDNILVTGQCIETALVPLAQRAFRERIARLASDQPLTVALFSSGAYPRDHMAILRRAAISLVEAGHTAHLFVGHSRRILSDFTRFFDEARRADAADRAAFDRLHIIPTRDRAEENRRLADLFPRLDLFVAPAHERTNWAVGLGLPQIILTPHIGSYAPLNARFASERHVAAEIGDVPAAELVHSLRRDGLLAAMAGNGFGKTAIDGFARAVDYIADNCPAKK